MHAKSTSLVGRALQQLYSNGRSNNEERWLSQKLAESGQPGCRVLEIGCGRGRFAKPAREAGWKYTGCDNNPETLTNLHNTGVNTISPEELLQSQEKYDAILLAHIIEHFEWRALVEFLNSAVTHLREDGNLLILTPLPWRGFYDDCDHIKPYPPEALMQLLCRRSGQVQPTGVAFTMRAQSIWTKRDPFGYSIIEQRLHHLWKVPLALMHRASLGLIGRSTGYGMVLKFIEPNRS